MKASRIFSMSVTSASQVLTLTIDPLTEQALDLVNVPQASNGIINANVTHSAVIQAWPFMRTGQPVWLEIKAAANRVLRDGTPAEVMIKRLATDGTRTAITADGVQEGDLVVTDQSGGT